MAQLRPAARVYISAVIVVGTVLTAILIWLDRSELILHGADDPFKNVELFGFWAVFAFLSSLAPVVASTGVTLSVSLAPLFAAAITLPPGLAALAGALGTLDARVPGRDIPWYRFFFNRAMFAVVYGTSALAYRAVIHLPGSHLETGGIDLQQVSAGIVALVVILALNTPLIIIAVSLASNVPLRKVAYQSLQGVLLSYAGLAPLGALLAYLVTTRQTAGYFLAGAIYLFLVIYRELSRRSIRLETVARGSYVAQSRLIDKKDRSTYGHSERVGILAEATAAKMGMHTDLVEQIRIGATLHDIGKIAIPDAILHKPGKLTAEEWVIMKTHAREGYEVLAEQDVLMRAADIVYSHHENFDGSGYPQGLVGRAIPVGGRITRVVDSYDCITNVRDYRAWVRRPFDALSELHSLSGTTYDPAVIEAFTEVMIERQPDLARELGADALPNRPGLLAALRYPPFVKLFTAQALSNFGDMLTTTGLALAAYAVSGSTLAVAAVFAARAVPNLLFGLVAGSIVDRYDRKTVMISMDLLRALLVIMVPLLITTHFALLLLITFLVSSATVLFNPARTAALPDLVPYHLLQPANAALTAVERITEILGYAAAGAIILLSSVPLLFAVDALTFAVSAGLLLSINFPEMIHAGVIRTRVWEQMIEGLRYIRSNQQLRVIFPFSFLMVTAGAALTPLSVPLALNHLHAGNAGFPLLETSIALGATVGAIATSVVETSRRGTLMLVGALGMGIFVALAGTSGALPLTMILFVAAGVANAVYLVPMTTAIQEITDSSVRGRVFAARFGIIQLGFLIGVGIAGLATSDLSPVPVSVAVIASGILMILVTSGAALSPALRRV